MARNPTLSATELRRIMDAGARTLADVRRFRRTLTTLLRNEHDQATFLAMVVRLDDQHNPKYHGGQQ